MYLIVGLPECSDVKEKNPGLIFGERKRATVVVAMEWQGWKVVSNNYSHHFSPIPAENSRNCSMFVEDLNGILSFRRMQVDARNDVFL